jgi:hypothetical protein
MAHAKAPAKKIPVNKIHTYWFIDDGSILRSQGVLFLEQMGAYTVSY